MSPRSKAIVQCVLVLGAALSASGPVQGQVNPFTTTSDSFKVLSRGASSFARLSNGECAGWRTTNTSYSYLPTSGATGVVIRVTEDVANTTCREGRLGWIAVSVWRQQDSLMPLTRFAMEGEESALYRDEKLNRARAFTQLFRITQFGCCGSNNIDNYVALLSGRHVFSASAPLQWFYANGTVRYVAVLADEVPALAPSGGWTPRTAAVILYGTGGAPAQIVAVPGDSAIYYMVSQLRLHRAVQPDTVEHPALAGPCCNERDTVAVSGVSLEFELDPQADTPTLVVSVPITNDRLGTPSIRRQP